MPRLTTPLSVLALVGASIALAACGSSSGGGSTNSAGASAGQGHGANQSAAFKKFQDCLKDNGVTLPDRGQRPGAGQGSGYGPPAGGDGTPPAGTDGTPPTGTNGTPPAGDAPRGGFADNPKFQAAMKACAKLRPQGLRGGPGAGRPQQNIQAFTPYLTCLKDKASTSRSPTAPTPCATSSATTPRSRPR